MFWKFYRAQRSPLWLIPFVVLQLLYFPIKFVMHPLRAMKVQALYPVYTFITFLLLIAVSQHNAFQYAPQMIKYAITFVVYVIGWVIGMNQKIEDTVRMGGLIDWPRAMLLGFMIGMWV